MAADFTPRRRDGLESSSYLPPAAGAAGATAVGAVHAASTCGLLTRAAGEGAFEAKHGAGDLVTHGGLALLRPGATGEETATGLASGCGGGGSARQTMLMGSGRLAATREETSVRAAGGGGGVAGLSGAEERHVGWFV